MGAWALRFPALSLASPSLSELTACRFEKLKRCQAGFNEWSVHSILGLPCLWGSPGRHRALYYFTLQWLDIAPSISASLSHHHDFPPSNITKLPLNLYLPPYCLWCGLGSDVCSFLGRVMPPDISLKPFLPWKDCFHHLIVPSLLCISHDAMFWVFPFFLPLKMNESSL